MGKYFDVHRTRVTNPIDQNEIDKVLSDHFAGNRRAEFYNRNLSGFASHGKLDHANFTLCNLRRADFSRASLHGAYFDAAYLGSVDFDSCDLSNVSFVDADLRGANLDRADIY